MAGIPDHILERIREQTDIVEVVGRHVGLKKSGKQWKGLCPFHEERSPSFYVDPVRRSFKCFGCGAWGDAFDFLQKVEGVGFLSAVRSLGARVGVALPDQDAGDVARAEQREREREVAYQINAAAAEFYRELLLRHEHGQAGREYQAARQISEAISESFKIGYAPAPSEAGWDALVRELQKRNLPLPAAEQLGLIVRSPRGNGWYDRFRGRLMFPIIQPGGRVLGFSGRILPQFAEAEEAHKDGKDAQKAPKYVNSPESSLYKKARTLFGLHAAGNAMRERERAILVEGQIDVVSMHGRGYTETVASLGTALTKPQVELLARFTDRVVLCYDGDRAGVKASYAALPVLLEQGMDVRIAPLEPGEDPDSADPERLANALRRPGSALEWLMKRMVDKGARQSIDAKARALRALVPLLRCVRGRDARGDYANLAADMLEIPARRVWAAVESGPPNEASGSSSERGRGDESGARERGHSDAGPSNSARVSQFPPGMPHSATMRSQPLPSGQASVTALLVDRPELARVAEREGILDRVTDQRLRPIVERVLRAALEGDAIPSEGELLDLVDPGQHRMLHDRLFGHAYLEVEDPHAALEQGLVLCERDQLEIEVRALEQQIASAQRRGDQDALHELVVARMTARRRQQELQASLRRH
ncbi:DNA primase [Nannocystaceae bacterium ST9]